MKEHRNPFLLRASEFIEGDATFVRYFGPGSLDVLKDKELLLTRMFLSAAGAGKTSLMRLFTPGPLLELHKHRDVEDYSELYATMTGFGVIDDAGPQLLGILVSCDRGYASLADIGLESTKQVRLLFALLDARLLLAAMRQALTLRRLSFEENLSRIKLMPPSIPVELAGLTLPCTGDVLYAWARRREAEICGILDSFSPENTSATGSEGLIALDLLKPAGFLIDDQPIAEHILIMLDDCQKLTTLQRSSLIRFILDKRSSTPTWIAERLEALTRDELLSIGSTGGRDYDQIIYLESHWREHHKRFEKVVSSVAERRVLGSRKVELFHFDPYLEDSIDEEFWQKHVDEAVRVVSTRVRTMAGKTKLFDSWVAEREQLKVSAYNKAVAWRELEILMERELRKKQQTFDFPLEASALEEKSDSPLSAAAVLFLANEFKLPYYYGPSMLAKLSSANIQQYLGLSGIAFEEIISAALIYPKQQPILSAVRQEALLTKAAQEMWEEIPRRAMHGSRVKTLIEAIGSFSRWYTERPSAPNDPGVNGIAISMADRNRLLDPNWLRHHPEHFILSEVLASALSHNLLSAHPDSKVKGQLWLVLNLNRLLCVRYRLPLNYGKFKEQRLDELVRWMEKGFDARRSAGDGELL